jgi:hypothetical protein
MKKVMCKEVTFTTLSDTHPARIPEMDDATTRPDRM